MKKFVISALAIAALAGTAVAQPVRLDLRIVPQNGIPLPAAGGGPITNQADTQHDDILTVGSLRRFEVQYRIVDTDLADAIFPAGLTAAQMNITAVLGGSAQGSVSRALLSNFEAQLAAATPPPATDPGLATTGANVGARGMHRPFRGGISGPTPPNNENAANGTVTPLAINGVTPLSLAQNDQNQDGWYGLFSFDFTGTNGVGTVSFNATLIPDPNSGNRFGYFNDGNPVPLNSANATAGTASVLVNIPAPGSMALLGLGGLVATRRRRA